MDLMRPHDSAGQIGPLSYSCLKTTVLFGFSHSNIYYFYSKYPDTTPNQKLNKSILLPADVSKILKDG